jgi:hypothetical protein
MHVSDKVYNEEVQFDRRIATNGSIWPDRRDRLQEA